jgi:hypothetical protein
VTRVSLTLDTVEERSAEFASFCSLGLVEIGFGAVPLLEVQLDAVESGNLVDLRPAAPFVMRW